MHENNDASIPTKKNANHNRMLRRHFEKCSLFKFTEIFLLFTKQVALLCFYRKTSSFRSDLNMGRPKRISKFVFHFFLIFILFYVLKQKPFQVVTRITYVRFLADLKHILLWWPIKGISDNGQEQFVKKRCPHLNCYFTSNRTFFNDTRIFDAIVFYAPYLTSTNLILPKHRSAGQKFIFASKDSPDKHPFCNPLLDGYFNWTWTYRTDSTIQYRFVSTYNLNNEKLGSHFQWQPNMSPLKRSQIAELSSKTKAAAWFSDECKSNSDREGFVTILQKELLQYNLTIDIFGKCGPKKCKRKNMNACYWRLKKTYFFYLALEDYIGADYVTTEVLHAFKGNAVPIVYGGADYSK